MARGQTKRDEMPAADVASFLREVEMPTVQHLLNGRLEPIRIAIRATSPERDPQQWVALHLILGTALRLRAHRLPVHERTIACVESLAAFESALAECCERKRVRQLRSSRIGTNQFSVQAGACSSGPDGVQMVLDASTVPVVEGLEMLSGAIRVFMDAAESTDRRTELRAWIIARSNLGGALTMLGQRTQGMDGTHRIEQAIDVLREAAASAAGEELIEERASAYVNLSEAFQALADRAMPGERLRYTERALDGVAVALSFFAPEEYRWLLELDRAAFA
jgi:hypothetical protein